MFSSLILYLVMAALGIIVGSKLLKPEKQYRWISNLQMTALIVLIFTMGARIGANRQIIESIGSMGLSAVTITLFSIAGSVFFVFLGRKLLRIGKKGVRTDD